MKKCFFFIPLIIILIVTVFFFYNKNNDENLTIRKMFSRINIYGSDEEPNKTLESKQALSDSGTITPPLTRPSIPNFINNVKPVKQQDKLIIKYNNINFTFKPLFHYNNNDYTIQEAKTLIPSLNFSQQIINKGSYYRWIPKISGIPEGLRGKFNISLNLVNWSGITKKDFKRKGKTIEFKNKIVIKIDFSDLLQNYSLKFLTKKNILIYNINCTECTFDPEITTTNVSVGVYNQTTNKYIPAVKLNKSGMPNNFSYRRLYVFFGGEDDCNDYDGEVPYESNNCPTEYGEGKYGYAPSGKNATKDRVYFGNNLSSTTGFNYDAWNGTYEVWFKAKNDSSNYDETSISFIVADSMDTTCVVGEQTLHRIYLGDDKVRIRIRGGGTSKDISLGHGTTWSEGDWIHFAHTWDIANQNASFYINGNIVNSTSDLPASTNNCNSTTHPHILINSAVEWADFFQEAIIYNYSKSPEEIKADYEDFYHSSGTYIPPVQNLSSDGTIKAVHNISWGSNEPDGTNISVSVRTKNASHNNTNLQLWLGLDNEYSEGTADDYSPDDRTATLQNSPTYNESGLVSGAYDFDGSTNQHITVSSFPEHTNATFMVWVNPSTVTGNHQLFSQSGHSMIQQFHSLNTIIRIYFINESGNVKYWSISEGFFVVNQWIHLTLVGNNTGLFLYSNGVLNNSITEGLQAPSGTGTLHIGVYSDGTSEEWDGLIDEVRVWDRILSATEISNIYNKEKDGYANWTTCHSRNYTNPTIISGNKCNGSYTQPTVYFETNGSDTPTLYNYTIGYGDLEVEDVTAPVITNLKNDSTTNVTTDITWTCSENCNFTINLYNSSDMKADNLIVFVSNDTFLTSHIQNISGLINHTSYSLNLSVWDSSGNEGINDTFNFTTRQNVVPAVDTCTCPSPPAHWNVNCIDNCSITSNCDIDGYNLNINGDIGFFEVLADIKAETIAIESECKFINIPDDGYEIIIG